MDDKNFHIGNVINDKLKERRISKREFAQMLGYSETGLYKVLKNDSIDTKLLLKMAEVLRTPVSYFLNSAFLTSDYISYDENASRIASELENLKVRIRELESQNEEKQQIINGLSLSQADTRELYKIYKSKSDQTEKLVVDFCRELYTKALLIENKDEREAEIKRLMRIFSFLPELF